MVRVRHPQGQWAPAHSPPGTPTPTLPHSTRPWEPQLGLSSSTRGGGTSMNPIASRTGVPTLKHPSSASLPSAQPPDYREFTPGDLKKDSDPWYSNPKKKKSGKSDRVSTASRIRQSVDRLENQTECRPTLCPIPPTADTLSDFRAGDTLSDFPPFFFSDPW